MSVYFGLVFLVLILDIIGYVFSPSSREKWKVFSLTITGIALFLVFVLRDYSVGRDIQGYCDIYENMNNHALFDASWTYMEWGYVLFMKACSMIGMSFRAFLSVLYIMVIIPILIYIKKFSKDITISLIVYICFQFFVFSMSALRQTLAMSICLLAYLSAQKNGVRAFLNYILLILFAALIHRSSVVFVPVYILMRWKSDFRLFLFYIIVIVFAYLSSGGFIEGLRISGAELENTMYAENLTIGAFFVFMFIIAVFAFVVTMFKRERVQSYSIVKSVVGKPEHIQQSLSNHLNLLICCLIIQIVFQGYMLMRAALFYQIAFIIVLPNLVDEFEKNVRPLLKTIILIGMVVIFYLATLLPNELDIVPYIFGV